VLACIPGEDPHLIVVVRQAIVRIGQDAKVLRDLLLPTLDTPCRCPAPCLAHKTQRSAGPQHIERCRAERPRRPCASTPPTRPRLSRTCHQSSKAGRAKRRLEAWPTWVRRAWLGGNRRGGLLIRGRPFQDRNLRSYCQLVHTNVQAHGRSDVQIRLTPICRPAWGERLRRHAREASLRESRGFRQVCVERTWLGCRRRGKICPVAGIRDLLPSGKIRTKMQSTFTMYGPKEVQRPAFEPMAGADDGDSLRNVLMMGSVSWLPSTGSTTTR
jgi:hypothetical protein